MLFIKIIDKDEKHISNIISRIFRVIITIFLRIFNDKIIIYNYEARKNLILRDLTK